jgi:NADPH:quinone reductase-like Zn-dependent oxidoreductase
MKAIVFDATGAPETVLRIEEGAKPAPTKPNEVLVRVAASPIHPADLAFIRGIYRIRPSFPQVAGLEGTGIVEAAGSAAQMWLGKRVAFRWPGSWAEYTVAPVERLIALPDAVDFDTGAQLSLNPLTALGLVETSGVRPGQFMLLTAATSSVAAIAHAIAKEREIGTIGIIRDAVESGAGRCPCDHVLSAGDPNLIEKLKVLGADRITALVDSVGGPLVPSLFPTLTPGSRVIAYGVQDPRAMEITNAMLIYRNLTWIGFGIDAWLAANTASLPRSLETIAMLITRNQIPLPVAGRHLIADFRRALEQNASSGRKGKVLLTF